MTRIRWEANAPIPTCFPFIATVVFPSDYQSPKSASSLADVSVGNAFVIERIPEELEFEPGLLEFLEESNLIPGENGTVTNVSTDGKTTVAINGKQVGIGAFASQRILVTVG